MALEDWKKEREDYKMIIWRNQKYYSVVSYLGKYKDVSKEAGATPKWSDKWYFEVDDPGMPRKFKLIQKLFKTKSQALQFAKAYMRKH